MATKIEWTDETWNPVVGCEHVSPGCDRCYAARDASGRLKTNPTYAGLAVAGVFTGEVRLLPDRLAQPLRWAKPRRVFVNSMSDLFHKDVPAEYIARVFAVMAATPRHTYQILTKRHGRMRALLTTTAFAELVDAALRDLMMAGHITERDCGTAPALQDGPLPNVWLGVSVEDQARADLRIPALLDTPAAVRFLSCEPLLGPINLAPPLRSWAGPSTPVQINRHLQWVIAGGESGPGARPMHPAWARTLRDQSVAAGVAFHFKQWGEWSPNATNSKMSRHRFTYDSVRFQPDGTRYQANDPDGYSAPGMTSMLRVGKRNAGRELDGRTWDEWPTITEGTPTPC